MAWSAIALALTLQSASSPPVAYDDRFSQQIARAPADSAVVHKVAEIPNEIRALGAICVAQRLAEFPIVVGMADSDQTYQLSDVGSGPMRRLVWAAQIGPYYLVNFEYGGAVSGSLTTVFDLSAGPPRYAGTLNACCRTRSAGALEMNAYRTFAEFRDAVVAKRVRLPLLPDRNPAEGEHCP